MVSLEEGARGGGRRMGETFPHVITGTVQFHASHAYNNQGIPLHAT
jgi:hypothetical protein